MVFRLFCISVLLSFISCSYDQDFEFVPQTQAGYFLMTDAGSQRLSQINPDGTIQTSWGQNLGIDNPSDMAGSGKDLWVSLAESSQLILLDLQAESEQARYDLQGFQGHHISMGDTYLLMSDTVQEELGFFHLKKRSLTRIQLSQKPGLIVYRSAKFFLVSGASQVAIYREEALAPVATLEFNRPIFDLVLDNSFFTYVYTQDTVNYRTGISWNSHDIEEAETVIVSAKERMSPFNRISFGSEFLQPINIIDERLSAFPGPSAQDFEVDFFSGQCYYLFQDSLRQIDLWTREIQHLGPFPGTFRKAYFYIDQADGV